MVGKKPLLQVKDLRVSLTQGSSLIHAVNRVSFDIYPGQTFALVGESGCGKTMTANAIMRLLPPNAILYENTEVYLNDQNIFMLNEIKMRQIRRKKIGMIFQDPMIALNPVMTIGSQLSEALPDIPKKAKREKCLELLASVKIPDPIRHLIAYPHQLSGGMKQRVMIAMALAKSPELLIADEPTTALDVTTQAQILDLIQSLLKAYQMAMLLITHDLGVVAQMADQIAVMYCGHLLETSPKEAFYQNPKHPYSKKLFASLPERSTRNQPLSVIEGVVPSLRQTFPLCRFKNRCYAAFGACGQIKPRLIKASGDTEVRCHWYDASLQKPAENLEQVPLIQSLEITKTEPEKITEHLLKAPRVLTVNHLQVYFPIVKGVFKRKVGEVKAVDGVDFKLFEGQTLAIVGESGCGKTTLGKTLLRLITATDGKVTVLGKNLFRLSDRKMRRLRNDIQMIFQDPYSSMNPRMRVKDIVEEGMIALGVGSNKVERENRIEHILEQVGLEPEMRWRYPHEFSGGQRQRIAVARALAVGPQIIVCDEPTSALDVSYQAQILNLLRSLQQEFDIAYVFITHNLGVVKYLADHILVMYLGRIVESGTAEQVLNDPLHPYTKALMSAVPIADPQHALGGIPKGEVPNAAHPPMGCHFAPRCPYVMPKCKTYPPNYEVPDSHFVKCYLYEN